MLLPGLSLLSRGKLTVLLFQQVPDRADPLTVGALDVPGFEQMLDVILTIFRIMPLVDASRALRAGNLPDRAACITFDGGYADWMRGVIPVLERRMAHATFFVSTGQFAGRPLWSERVVHSVRNAPAGLQGVQLSGVDSPRVAFSDLHARVDALDHLCRFLRTQSPEHRGLLIQELEEKTGTAVDEVPRMPVADLQAIHAKGFDIGANSVDSPALSRCSIEQARCEIGASKEYIESVIRGRVTAFSYPHGIPLEDFNQEHVQAVRQCGYELAVGAHRGVASAQSSMFQIPRYRPAEGTKPWQKLRLLGNLLEPRRQVAEPQREGGRRVLMVAFHFPPQAGSSGILRTLNFVRHLPSHHWSPIVLTASPSAYEEQRNDLIAAVPPNTPILRSFALDAARHMSIAKKYPGILALPDRWSTWWFSAVLKGMKVVKQQKPAAIWSTYPISSAHLIAATINRLTGLPWIADFRDPMLSEDFPPSGMQRNIWRLLEAHVLRSATACVFTTDRAAKEYAIRYPLEAYKCEVVPNGYDETAFTGISPVRQGVHGQTLLMLHSGLIYPRDRDPSTFFGAVRDLIDEGVLERKHLRIRFRAPKHGDEVCAAAARHGLDDVIEISPPVPYGEAIAEMLGADLLLVFQGPRFNAQIPAKIYEYLRAQGPLLALLDPAGDTAVELSRFDGVFMGDIASSAAIRQALLAWLDALKLHGGKMPPRPLDTIKSLSRAAQAERLSRLLNMHTGRVRTEI